MAWNRRAAGADVGRGPQRGLNRRLAAPSSAFEYCLWNQIKPANVGRLRAFGTTAEPKYSRVPSEIGSLISQERVLP